MWTRGCHGSTIRIMGIIIGMITTKEMDDIGVVEMTTDPLDAATINTIPIGTDQPKTEDSLGIFSGLGGIWNKQTVNRLGHFPRRWGVLSLHWMFVLHALG